MKKKEGFRKALLMVWHRTKRIDSRTPKVDINILDS